MSLRCFFRKICKREGQSIVEISLITPLLLVALYIPADFGIAFLTAHLTQNAVREVARLGSAKDPFDSAVSTTLKNDAISRIPTVLSGKTATVELWATGATDCARFVQVTGGGNYNYFLYRLIAMLGFSPPDPATMITRTARMRYAAQPSINHTPCTAATITSP